MGVGGRGILPELPIVLAGMGVRELGVADFLGRGVRVLTPTVGVAGRELVPALGALPGVWERDFR